MTAPTAPDRTRDTGGGRPRETYDVAVVGAGIAGCTTAMLYAREGLSVLLLEAHRDAATFKRLCTHQIQSTAVPTLQRLGVCEDLVRAGARRSRVVLHTRGGWVLPPAPEHESEFGYNVRRSVLDPFLRHRAGSTDGVVLRLGAKVRSLRRDGDTVTGLVYTTADRREHEVAATLVVGADGRNSTVGKLADVPVVKHHHGRHALFAHFESSSASSSPLREDVSGPTLTSRLWLRDPDILYTFPTDGDRFVVAAMMPPAARSASAADHDGQLRAAAAAAPDGPDLSDAVRVSEVVGVKDYPTIRRRPSAPGLALVGDAASSTDYLWGIGCGWAFKSAEWLVDSTAPALAGRRGLSRGLRAYAWRRRRELTLHQMWNDSYAGGRRLSLAERTLLSGAAVDPGMARRALAFGARSVGFTRFVNPVTLGRSAVALARAPRPAPASSGAPTAVTPREGVR